MTDQNSPSGDRTTTTTPPAAAATAERPPFVEPKLRFIEPQLTPRGDLRRVTAGFFGSFNPSNRPGR